jgi:hypothetical protein
MKHNIGLKNMFVPPLISGIPFYYPEFTTTIKCCSCCDVTVHRLDFISGDMNGKIYFKYTIYYP